MEVIIALLSGGAGGSLICSLSPKISVNGWLSFCGGMAGGIVIYLVVTKVFLADSETVGIYSLLSIMLVGFAGGALTLLPLFLIRLRKHR